MSLKTTNTFLPGINRVFTFRDDGGSIDSVAFYPETKASIPFEVSSDIPQERRPRERGCERWKGLRNAAPEMSPRRG